MARPNLWNKNRPRVELDHRARDARLKLVRIERLLVPCVAVPRGLLNPLLRLAGLRLYGNGRRGDRTAESLSDGQKGSMADCGTFCCP